MKIEQDVKLDFDDVLIKPKRSESPSRSTVQLNRKFKFKYSPYELDCIPLIAANMDTTGSISMAKSLTSLECLTALHKFYPVEMLVKHFTLSDDSTKTWYTLGISEKDENKLREFEIRYRTPQLINIDVANGYSQYFVEFCKKIRSRFPFATIMAGNIATPEMAQELVIGGKVDIVKVGIGPGSVCLTRMKTGVGFPQLSAIAECADVVHGLGAHICGDGGCKYPKDICKAFGAGADFVMLGGMLAGTEECEGIWEYEWKHRESGNKQWSKYNWNDNGLDSYTTGSKRLRFHGMSSKEAMDLHHGGMADYKASEGEEITVPYKGKAEEVIKDILGSLRGCASLIGAESLKDIPKCCTFVRVNRIK
jgi:GMP reductase